MRRKKQTKEERNKSKKQTVEEMLKALDRKEKRDAKRVQSQG